MNILFRNGSGESASQLINMLREKIKPEFSIICTMEDQLKNFEIKGKELFLDYYVLLEGKYDESLMVPPIDEEILSQLRPYYYEIFRIIGRNGAFYNSYPKREELFIRTARYWNWALDYYEIDLCLGFSVPHFSYDIIIYYLCKIKKIKTLDIWHTSIPSYVHFVEDLNDIGNEVVGPYTNYLKRYIDEEIETIDLCGDFKNNYELHTSSMSDRTPSYMKETILQKTKKCIKGLYSYYIYLKSNNKSSLRGLIMKTCRILDNGNYIKCYNKNVSKIDYNENEKYIYVPLHMQPEATTCPLGGVYANQILMISMLSYNLPKDVYLYIKENPKQTNSERSIVFLDEMLKLKNVKLISAKEDTFKLIENCIAVATVTGTAAWEALFRKKAAIIFGTHINKFAPGVFVVRNNIDCREAFDKIFGLNDNELFLKKMKIFMLALEDVCFKSHILSEVSALEEKRREDLENTCNEISSKIINMLKT